MKSKVQKVDYFVDKLGSSELEALEVIKNLINKFGLFSSVDLLANAELAIAKKAAIEKPQRLSKNGKPLGRPKGSLGKKKIAEAIEKVKPESKPKPLIASLTGQVKTFGTNELVKKFDPNFIYEKITGCEMGKEYLFYILYKTDEGYLRSKKILENWNPEGVIVPYQATGLQFVLSLNDEYASFSLKQAEDYAAKQPKIRNNSWRVVNQQQIGAIKVVEDEINALLKKLGAEPFVENYLNGGRISGKKAKLKIRYAVDI